MRKPPVQGHTKTKKPQDFRRGMVGGEGFEPPTYSV